MKIYNDVRYGRWACISGALAVTVALAAGAWEYAQAQAITKFDRDRGTAMLRTIKDDLKKNYYDTSFHGMDVEARFQAAEAKMQEAQSIGQTFGIIAQVLMDLNDSHTFFNPPSRAARTDYGWQMQVIGNTCYVIAVKPGSDAEEKGLKVGDAVISVDGLTPTREDLWKLKYLYYRLRPQPGMRLVVQSPGGAPRPIDVMAKIKQGKRVKNWTGSDGGGDIWDSVRESENEDRLNRHRYYETDDVLIWKMPQFDLDDHEMDRQMGKVKKRPALILDLRGNPGGAVVTLQRLTGHFFESDLKIADLKGRKPTKPMLAKTRGKNVFPGKLVVLVDSGSGSAAEVFARVVQLEKRGTVIGDRTAGKVMQSQRHPHRLGQDTVVFYGASITNADLIMADGKSLENVGVTPDEVRLPTGEDLAAERDPVMVRAAELVGLKMDPKKAGSLFPIEWQK